VYTHRHKAGNRCDVWKHFWLCEVVQRLPPNPAGPVIVLDAHCGEGRFRREDAREWESGIGLFGRTAAATLGRFGQAIAPRLDMSEYLGSWALIATVLADRHVEFELLGCDLSSEVRRRFEENASSFMGSGSCRFTQADGYKIAGSCSGLSLVFLDPPYWPDADKDWQALCGVIPNLQSSNDTIAVWYPIYGHTEPEGLVSACGLTGYEIRWADEDSSSDDVLKGCGLGIVSQRDLDLSEVQPTACEVARILGGRYSIRLAKEN
jgi:23S rRNA A2030 N6-methylase RlmJ